MIFHVKRFLWDIDNFGASYVGVRKCDPHRPGAGKDPSTRRGAEPTATTGAPRGETCASDRRLDAAVTR